MAPDLSAGLDLVQGISRVFREPSNIDPHTSHPRTKTRFTTSLSCDLEPDTTKYTSIKIFVSYDLTPDTPDGLDMVGDINYIFSRYVIS